MMTWKMRLAIIATLTAGPACAADAMMSIPTATFAPVALSSNAFEIRSSELALDRARASDVKDFATMMIADHGKADTDLRAALDKAPSPDAPLAPKHADMIALLEGAEGAEFERLYIDMQTGAHLEAVSLFETYAETGDDPEVVRFAEATLPVLEAHKRHILEIVASR